MCVHLCRARQGHHLPGGNLLDEEGTPNNIDYM